MRIYFKNGIIILLCFLSINGWGQSFGESIRGLWDTGDGDNSKISIYQDTEGVWHGKIVETDVRRSVGKMLFTDGVLNEEEKEVKGILIHPDSGIRVSGTLSLENSQKLRVFARKLFIFKTFYWMKYQ